MNDEKLFYQYMTYVNGIVCEWKLECNTMTLCAYVSRTHLTICEHISYNLVDLDHPGNFVSLRV